MKMEREPKNIARFMRDMTIIRQFNDIIDADFGENAREMLATFLDNGVQMTEIGGKAVLDVVLRLNLYRFTAGMPPIYRAALRQSRIEVGLQAASRPHSSRCAAQKAKPYTGVTVLPPFLTR